jgi:hypothetical protein
MSCFRSVRNSLRSKLNIRVLFWVMPRFVDLVTCELKLEGTKVLLGHFLDVFLVFKRLRGKGIRPGCYVTRMLEDALVKLNKPISAG